MNEGERLKTAREHAGITQAGLAKKSGVGQSAIGNIEAGIRGFGASVIRMAEACGVNAHWLATGEGQMLNSNTTTANIKFSVAASEQPDIVDALHTLDEHLNGLAPVFSDAAREALRKWALGLSSIDEAANALHAMALASESLGKR
jgi:transcriptional regulator with XRE-family HTH domain